MIVKPYVYRLTHKNTREFYIGYRQKNTLPAQFDLGCEYRSSSDIVEEMGFDNFEPEILCEFDDGDQAYDYEQKLIKHHIQDHLCLNKHYIDVATGHKHFKHDLPHSDEAKAKMSLAKIGNSIRKGTKHTTEARQRQSESHLGVGHSNETRAKMSATRKGKPKSEEHKRKIAEAHKRRREMNDRH